MTTDEDKVNDSEIPKNATIREEYVKCGNVDCKKCSSEAPNKDIHGGRNHGPYLYAYWKQGKKLQKEYIGKSWEDHNTRRIAQRVDSNHHK